MRDHIEVHMKSYLKCSAGKGPIDLSPQIHILRSTATESQPILDKGRYSWTDESIPHNPWTPIVKLEIE